MATEKSFVRGLLRRAVVVKHYGPGTHPAKPLSAEAIINLQEPDINCWFDSSPRGTGRRIRQKCRRMADRLHASRTQPVEKHYGPGPHPGTGTEQTVHGGGGATVSEEAVAQAGEEPKDEEEEAEREPAGPRMPSSLTALRGWISPRTTIEENDETACQEFLDAYAAGNWNGIGEADDARNPSAIAALFAEDLEESMSSPEAGEPDYEAMREDYEGRVDDERAEAMSDVQAEADAFDGLSHAEVANTLGLTEEEVRTADEEGELSDWYWAYANARVMNNRYGENLTWSDLREEGSGRIEDLLLETARNSVPGPDSSDYEPEEGERVLDFSNAEDGQRFYTARAEDGSVVAICETKDRTEATAQYNIAGVATRLIEEGRDPAEANSPYIYLDLLASRESRQGYSSELMFNVLRRADQENRGLVGVAVDGAGDYYDQFGAIWFDRYHQPGTGGVGFWPPSAVHEAVRMLDMIAEQVRKGEMTLSMTERSIVQGILRRVYFPETPLTTEGLSSRIEMRHVGPGDHPSGSPEKENPDQG